MLNNIKDDSHHVDQFKAHQSQDYYESRDAFFGFFFSYIKAKCANRLDDQMTCMTQQPEEQKSQTGWD